MSGILDAVLAVLEPLEVRVEPTKSAVMIKRARTFAEVKPRPGRTELAFVLSRRLDHPRVVRTLDLTARRIVHVLELADASGVDDEVAGWLREAYADSPL